MRNPFQFVMADNFEMSKTTKNVKKVLHLKWHHPLMVKNTTMTSDLLALFPLNGLSGQKGCLIGAQLSIMSFVSVQQSVCCLFVCYVCSFLLCSVLNQKCSKTIHLFLYTSFYYFAIHFIFEQWIRFCLEVNIKIHFCMSISICSMSVFCFLSCFCLDVWCTMGKEYVWPLRNYLIFQTF